MYFSRKKKENQKLDFVEDQVFPLDAVSHSGEGHQPVPSCPKDYHASVEEISHSVFLKSTLMDDTDYPVTHYRQNDVNRSVFTLVFTSVKVSWLMEED